MILNCNDNELREYIKQMVPTYVKGSSIEKQNKTAEVKKLAYDEILASKE